MNYSIYELVFIDKRIGKSDKMVADVATRK